MQVNRVRKILQYLFYQPFLLFRCRKILQGVFRQNHPLTGGDISGIVSRPFTPSPVGFYVWRLHNNSWHWLLLLQPHCIVKMEFPIDL